MQRIILTGGGSAGHVIPNMALIPHLQEAGWDVAYIGTEEGIERSLIGTSIPYYPIAAGKLRRYLDWQNLRDPFRVIKGTIQALGLLRRLKPTVVFSKGGFVSVPTAAAARLLGIPVILHESDLTPGLANRLLLPLAVRICATFPETCRFLPPGKTILTGTPIRDELRRGERQKGLELCRFHSGKPVLLVMGGSLGSVRINEVVRESLEALCFRFQIAHICGRGNLSAELTRQSGYCQFEFVAEELANLFAAADFVVSRAGANSLFELLALRKPNLLIPLSKAASRGDQIDNARSFAQQGFSTVLFEEELSPTAFVDAVTNGYAKRESLIRAMANAEIANGTANVLRVIAEVASAAK